MLEHAERVSRLVEAASRDGLIHANCLQRSLVLWCLLRRQGISTDLCIGARKAAAGFEAHAWVQLDGAVLNDTGDMRERYAPFDRAICTGQGEQR